MKNIDFLSLDGRSLRTFLVVMEEMSISKAADRLGVTQSAVSHLLDKLRLALGDPLFVRAGRGITATERALALREPIQAVLDDLKALTNDRVFDPRVGQLDFTIAANDFQRDLIFPGLVHQLKAQGTEARFRFISSGIPAVDFLRQARCQLVVTPFPPDGPDIYQSRLFDDEIVCFYDAGIRAAPTSLEEYQQAPRIEVLFDDDESSQREVNRSLGMEPQRAHLSVPNFSALPAFLEGSDLVATLPSLIGLVSLKGFASSPLPFATKPLTMYMAWHKRDHLDPAHQWLRQQIRERVDILIG